MAYLVLPQVSKLGLALSTFTLVLLSGITPRLEACMPSPPQPRCSKTLVLAKAGPPAVFVPAGVAPSFSVPYTVFWNLTNVGSPSLCPPPGGPGGTFPATITMNVTCNGGPGLPAPIVIPVNLFTGYNTGSIPVTLPVGPQRFCTIVGRVDLGLLDGMNLAAIGDNVVCVVEAAPNDPSIPRLDLQTLTTAIQPAHPGDQGQFDYRVTNNDPTESVTIGIDAEMENVSRLPEMNGAGPPGTGVFSASDPIAGDNFPIGFDDDLTPAGCIFLPGDPGNPDLATAEQIVTLDPGESYDFSLHTRAWGLCADGSCGEGRLILDGTFANGDPALSCTGLVHAVDTSAPPRYQWPGSGRVVQMKPLDQNAVALFGEPLPGFAVQVDNVSFPTKAAIGTSPALVQPQLDTFENMNSERVRYSYQISLPDQAILPGEQGFFAWNTQLFSPIPSDTLQITDVTLHAPHGYENIGPGAIVSMRYDSFGPPLANIFDIMYQVSAHAVDADTGDIVPIEIVSMSLDSVGPSELAGFAQFAAQPPGPNSLNTGEGVGLDYEFIVLNVDVRAFAHGIGDSDLDGAPDSDDNCVIAQNGLSIPDAGGNVQLDTDGDGIGNICDADIGPQPNDCLVNFVDLNIERAAFFATPLSPNWNPDADFNGDQVVNFLDLGLMRRQFFAAPGPSGAANLCD